jgi:ribosome-associated translation inhibitor RaiA
MVNIKISCGKGNSDMTSFDKEEINKVISEYTKKIERSFKEEINTFEVYSKCYKKEGNVKRYSIDVRVGVPQHNFEVSNEDWDLQKSVIGAMKKMLNEIEHKVHSSEKPVNIRKPQKVRARK